MKQRTRRAVVALSVVAVSAGIVAPVTAAAKKPTGKPILLGWIAQDAPGAVPTYLGTAEAKAAVDYINKFEGGIGGRPLSLITCATKGTPESSQACANQMIAKKVKIVTKNIDNGWDGAIEPLKNANIPVVGGLPTQPNEFSASNSFYMVGGSPSIIVGMSIYALGAFKPKSAAIITSTNPAAKAALPLSSGPFVQGAKITPTVVEAPDDAADYTQYATTLLEPKPDVIIALISPPQCVGVMKALRTAGNTVPVITTGLCQDPKILAAAGDAIDNWYFGAGGADNVADPTEPSPKFYAEAWKKISKKPASQVPNAYFGFVSTYAVARYMQQIGPKQFDGTNKMAFDAVKAFMTKPGLTDPISGDALQCGRSKLFTAVCGFGFRAFTYKAGKITDASGGKNLDAFIG
jgi:branched-chain amino acid transport system substrate-binding protein